MNKKKAIKIATATAIAASGFVAVAPSQSQAAANVPAEVSKAKKVMYDAMYTYSKPYVADGTLTSRTVVYAAYKKGEAQYKYAVNVLKYEKDAKKRAAYKADLDKVRNNYLLGRALSYIKTLNALELKIQPAAKKLDAVVASANVTEQQIKDAQAEFKKAYDAQQKDLVAVVESNIEATVKQDAKAVYDKSNAAAAKKAEEVSVPKVVNVSAINQSTLTVTGQALNKLTAADVTVEGNKVTTYAAATDGKSATVTLEGTLPANSDVKVTVKDSTGSKDYTVKFGFEPKAVSLQASTFDDDKKGQKLTVLVDGVATSVDYLLSAGYTVTFNAYNDNTGIDDNLALFGNATSNDGKLKEATAIATGTYNVQVIVSKGATVLTSARAKVEVRNLDNTASSIQHYTLTNTTSGGFKQASNTLVIGDVVTLTDVLVAAGSSAAEVSDSTVELKSSDNSVISVDTSNGTPTITADSLGTATVTVTVGNATKTITLNVKGEARKATKATVSNQKVVVGSNSVDVKVTDQYGDPIVGATNLTVTAPTSVTYSTAPASTLASASVTGISPITFTTTTPDQSGTVLIKNADGQTVGSFLLTTTAVNTAASTLIKIDSSSLSTDDTINPELATTDATVTYNLTQYTRENVSLGTVADLGGYILKFNHNLISVAGTTVASDPDTYTVDTGTANLVVSGVAGKSGTTTLAVYKGDGTLVGTKTVTVSASTPVIKSVAWKAVPSVIDYATTINYEDVLDIVKSTDDKDNIVKGITLSSAVVNSIRYDEATYSLYIDKNDDGDFTVADGTALGTLAVSSAASATGEASGVSAVSGTTGVTLTGAAAKGNLIFSLTDTRTTSNPVVATKSVFVEIK